MNPTLAQLAPVASSLFASAAMVRLGTAKQQLRLRKPSRCAACGVETRRCSCS